MTKLWLVSALILISVASGSQAKHSPKPVTIELENDPYSAYYVGCAPARTESNFWAQSTAIIQLCAAFPQKGERVPTVKIRFYHGYVGDWIGYRRAALLGGEDLPIEVSRNVGSCRATTLFGGGCNLAEHVIITVPPAKLNDCHQFGLGFKLYGAYSPELRVVAKDCEVVGDWVRVQMGITQKETVRAPLVVDAYLPGQVPTKPIIVDAKPAPAPTKDE